MIDNRINWTFQFAAETLEAAAEKKTGHHDARLLFWEEALKIAEIDLKEKGVDIREYEVSGGKSIDFVMDPGLKSRYNKSSERIDYHRHRIADYARYYRAFELSPNKVFELTISDMEYFGL